MINSPTYHVLPSLAPHRRGLPYSAVVMKRIRKWLLRLAMLPALVIFLLATSSLNIGKWSGLKFRQHQYRHLTQPDEQTEVMKQEKR
jgi:hypothetical protein